VSPDRGGLGDPVDWEAAAQGDVLAVDHLVYWAGDEHERLETPHGVALLSQTCDLVQDRERVIIAPVSESSPGEMSQVMKGMKPLLLAVDSAPNHVVNLERMISVPRALLSNTIVLHHSVQERSGEEADRLSARIGRGLYRFAFPNEVHDALRKMKNKIVNGYTKDTSLARVLHVIDEFRISCVDWEAPGRDLAITAVVPDEYLPHADARPDGWKWSTSTVSGLKNGEAPATTSLERISELILENVATENDGALVMLWELWITNLSDAVVPDPTAEVASVTMEVMSDAEYTYKQHKASETLDFSVLSDSTAD
jgi:hypothetical protein